MEFLSPVLPLSHCLYETFMYAIFHSRMVTDFDCLQRTLPVVDLSLLKVTNSES